MTKASYFSIGSNFQVTFNINSISRKQQRDLLFELMDRMDLTNIIFADLKLSKEFGAAVLKYVNSDET